MVTATENHYGNLLANMAFCGIAALGIARKYGEVDYGNRVAANRFIGNWATKARKDGRFPLALNNELDKLAAAGTKGAAVLNLEKSLDEIWRSYSNAVERAKGFPASYKRRLQNAASDLRTLGWEAIVPLVRDWEKEGVYVPHADNTVFVIAEHMEQFDELGRLKGPLSVFVVSNQPQVAIDAFYKAGILLFEVSSNVYDGRKQFSFEMHPRNLNEAGGLKVSKPSKATN